MPCLQLPVHVMLVGSCSHGRPEVVGKGYKAMSAILEVCLSTVVQGWSWVNEGKSPLRPKWGFVSEQPGDSLVVTVRRRSATPHPLSTASDCWHKRATHVRKFAPC